ncbi:MAG: hypothetical protein M5U34_00670 [Chloroflexi bacterium]|nr:hypothetical protein [Chloroflexota bacterium]
MSPKPWLPEKAYLLSVIYLSSSEYQRQGEKPFSNLFGATSQYILDEFADIQAVADIPLDELTALLVQCSGNSFTDPKLMHAGCTMSPTILTLSLLAWPLLSIRSSSILWLTFAFCRTTRKRTANLLPRNWTRCPKRNWLSISRGLVLSWSLVVSAKSKTLLALSPALSLTAASSATVPVLIGMDKHLLPSWLASGGPVMILARCKV